MASRVLLETLALDYLTVVTETCSKIQHLFRTLSRNSDEVEIGNLNDIRDSYCSLGGMLAGPAPRTKKGTKWTLQVPGLLAHTAAQLVDITESDLWISRFDLQVTLPIDDAPGVRSIYRILSNNEEHPWQQRGKTPVVTIMENTQGGETLYVGKRTSDIMQRIYRKTIEDQPYLRWELEVKGRVARNLAEQGILTDRNMQATLARSIIAGLPGAAQQHMLPFLERIGEGTGEVKRSGYEASDEQTLQWLANTAIPALKKAMEGRFKPEVVHMLVQAGIPLATRVGDAAYLTNRSKVLQFGGDE